MSQLLEQAVGLIDCTILMYCRETGSPLWTRDKKLLNICKKDDLYTKPVIPDTFFYYHLSFFEFIFGNIHEENNLAFFSYQKHISL